MRKSCEKLPLTTIAQKAIAVWRQGDPAILIADGKKAADILGWEPQYKDIKDMILHAWKFQMKLKKTNT